MTRWIIYSRADCSLCERMVDELTELLGTRGAAHDVQVIDIAGDLELERKYAARIPVLLADGEFLCAYTLDPDRVELYLRPQEE